MAVRAVRGAVRQEPDAARRAQERAGRLHGAVVTGRLRGAVMKREDVAL